MNVAMTVVMTVAMVVMNLVTVVLTWWCDVGFVEKIFKKLKILYLDIIPT